MSYEYDNYDAYDAKYEEYMEKRDKVVHDLEKSLGREPDEDEILEEMQERRDAELLAEDPYAYYGVRRSDFF